MNKPTVSVILPNYNHAAYLQQRIDSILNQTFQDFELIILDDHSTDSSPAVIEKYSGHAKISHIIFNDTNSGSTFKQWVKGISLAAADLIWIAESDDFADQRFLEVLTSRILDQPHIGLAYCQSWVVGTDGEKMHLVTDWLNWIDTNHWKEDFESSGNSECINYLISQNTICNASAVIFRKALFLDAYQPTPLKLMGDWLLWFNILMKCDLAYVAYPLNFFRTHTGNVRNKFTNQVAELKEAIFVIEEMRKSNSGIKHDGVILGYKIVVNRVLSRLVNNNNIATKEELRKYVSQQLEDTLLPGELLTEIDFWINRANQRKSRLSLVLNWIRTKVKFYI